MATKLVEQKTYQVRLIRSSDSREMVTPVRVTEGYSTEETIPAILKIMLGEVTIVGMDLIKTAQVPA